MAIERMPATPIEGTVESEPEELSITIENPDSVAIETEDGGMIIDFDPEGQDRGESQFNSNLTEFIDDNELVSLGSKLISEYTGDRDSRKEWEETYMKGSGS